MKRQSKAEEALRKQVKLIKSKMDTVVLQQNALDNQFKAYQMIRDQLEQEISMMEHARHTASIGAKP